MIKKIKGNIKEWMGRFKREVKDHHVIYILLFIVLIAALFFRVYRVDQLLGFYYDQGRDAQVIWDFWHKGKMFLIGPTTGIAGIFRGPWYYWLIAPFYLIGGGDPGFPAVFLSLTTLVAVVFVYIIASKVADRSTGVFAAAIAGLSYYLLLASRWLSNPTPMLLISMLLIFSMFLAMEGKKWAWLAIGFLIGMAMQFGSAAEVFYFPAVVIFAIWQRRNLGSKKIMIASIFLIFFAFVPQIIFDLIHQGILRTAIAKFLFTDKSFKVSFWEMVKIRVPFYQDVFMSKINPSGEKGKLVATAFMFASLLINWRSLWANKYFKVILLLLVSPLIGMFFFQGNFGNVYDYYFTGYYFIFVLVFSILVVNFVQGRARFVIPALFLIVFFQQNLLLDRNYVVSGVDGPTTVAMGNELQAVDWAFKDAGGREFNFDSYVPPVIPYSYNYLFVWQATKRCGVDLCNMKLDKHVSLLYTVFETDPPHPERLQSWMVRQAGIGSIQEEVKFGGVSVQRRVRFNIDK
ncbi:MAG TPA: glycosyltransferase family 39 protein [Patescibacteria group bacterium]